MTVRLRGAGSILACPLPPLPTPHPTETSPAGIFSGFVPRGTLCALQNPPSPPLFINIRAKFSLFKLLVAAEILIVGFKFRIRRVGRWGHEWEFSIFGSGAARV